MVGLQFFNYIFYSQFVLLMYYFFLPPLRLLAEGLCLSGGAPAVGCGAVAGFHHLLVRGVWHHEEQLSGPLQGAGVSNLHLPARGLYPGGLSNDV